MCLFKFNILYYFDLKKIELTYVTLVSNDYATIEAHKLMFSS